MFCKNCGQPVNDGSRFCKCCGATLTPPAVTPESAPAGQSPQTPGVAPPPGYGNKGKETGFKPGMETMKIAENGQSTTILTLKQAVLSLRVMIVSQVAHLPFKKIRYI